MVAMATSTATKPAAAAPAASRLSEDQVCRAVEALLKHAQNEKRKGKPQLIEQDEFLYLVVALKRTPEAPRTKPYRIPIPHSIYPIDSSEVCLFVKDKAGEGHKEAKLKIRQTEGTGVAKVLGVSKLKSKFKPHEAKRRLILPVLPKLLGKTFFRKKRQPIPVHLQGANWKTPIRQACDATYLFISGGACSVIRVGKTSQSAREIADNVLAASQGVAGIVSKGWSNIQALHLKTAESVALPIYNSVPQLPTKIDGGTGKVVGSGVSVEALKV
eukprot:jgi/Chlat1/7258/Chrsp58S06904